MKMIVQALSGAIVVLALHVSYASAQWVGGARTWAYDPTANQSAAEIYVPYVSDYPNNWGQDQYDTYVHFYNGEVSTSGGNVITESCWQSWAGAGAECRNPTTTSVPSTGNYYDVWNEGFGGIDADFSLFDYFFEEVAPVYPAQIILYGVAWGE